jgi:hypothetical protein
MSKIEGSVVIDRVPEQAAAFPQWGCGWRTMRKEARGTTMGG